MSEQEILQVNIYGEPYSLRVTPEEKETMAEIVAYVNETMHRLGDNNSRMQYQDVAVLAAMNLAQELFRARKDHSELLELLEVED